MHGRLWRAIDEKVSVIDKSLGSTGPSVDFFANSLSEFVSPDVVTEICLPKNDFLNIYIYIYMSPSNRGNLSSTNTKKINYKKKWDLV